VGTYWQGSGVLQGYFKPEKPLKVFAIFREQKFLRKLAAIKKCDKYQDTSINECIVLIKM
jgi:hypothetical protein